MHFRGGGVYHRSTQFLNESLLSEVFTVQLPESTSELHNDEQEDSEGEEDANDSEMEDEEPDEDAMDPASVATVLARLVTFPVNTPRLLEIAPRA